MPFPLADLDLSRCSLWNVLPAESKHRNIAVMVKTITTTLVPTTTEIKTRKHVTHK